MSEPDVRWSNGGHARVESIAGDAIVLRSTVSSPPGSRLEGSLFDEVGWLRVKVHGCRRQPEGDFLVSGRTLDATRAQREAIETRVRAKG